ncbi:hypothetical protein JCM11641_007587 [Rhodosporidiobolus odoratus]
MPSSDVPSTRLTDPTFLEGLRVVLEPYYARRAPQDEIDAVVKRAEAFFLSSRADLDVTLSQPATDLSSVPPASSSPSTSEPPYPPTFSELAALISSGAPVPGIRDIPDQLSSETPSESTVAAKGGAGRKPWENAGEVEGRVGKETAGEVGRETRHSGEEGQEKSLEQEVREEQRRQAAEEGSGQV